MSGFVYIWRDVKHHRYYIGSHWGTEDDGYICSSNAMREAHRRRPHDFKRRIISRITTTRQNLLQEEQRWLNMIPKAQFGNRYYNINGRADRYHWWMNEETRKQVGMKIGEGNKRRIARGEQLPGSKEFNQEMSRKAHAKSDHPFHGKAGSEQSTRVKFQMLEEGRHMTQNPKSLEKAREKGFGFKKGNTPWNKGISTKGTKWSQEQQDKYRETIRKRKMSFESTGSESVEPTTEEQY